MHDFVERRYARRIAGRRSVARRQSIHLTRKRAATLQLFHELEDLQGCVYCAHFSKPNFSARSSSILTDDGCQLARPRGVRSRMDSSRVQIA